MSRRVRETTCTALAYSGDHRGGRQAMSKTTTNKKTSNAHRRWRNGCALGLLVPVLCSIFYGSEVDMPRIESAEPAPRQDYSRFTHDTQQHRRLPCLVCHVRADNRATPRMPGHIPCSSCHTEQFAAGNQHPMCYICHTATDVKRFPPLRSFNAVFDHARHARQTG